MKEVTRIYLAKTAYDIEITAKASLQSYLENIARAMDSDDAMREIEARMVELLTERGVTPGGVISDADVSALQHHMGEPGEFSEDGASAQPTDRKTRDDPADQPTRRLLRDPDNAVLAGVCAGIAAYLKVDPLWVRIGFVLLLFVTFGMSVIIYIVLWASLPEAQTAAEKLQMRGQPVTFDSLKAQTVTVAAAHSTSERPAVRFVRYVVAFMLLLMTLAAMLGVIVGSVVGFDIVMALQGWATQSWAWGLWGSLLAGGIMLISLLTLLTYSSFTWRIKKPVGMSMLVLLVVGTLSLSSVALFGMQAGREFSYESERMTTHLRVPLPDTTGVKQVVLEHVTTDRPLRQRQVSLRRAGTEEALRIEASYLAAPHTSKPEITATTQGDKLIVTVRHTDKSCAMRFETLCEVLRHDIQVRVFGPSQLIVNETDRFGRDILSK